MKGLPKIRFSRKLGIILGGVVVLSGTTGAAAVYIGSEALLGPPYEKLNGMACNEVSSVVIKKKDRFWVRKYITTEPTDGITRVKTALRVASAVYAEQKPDLVQVVVLDKNGPVGRTEMRGRAVGADVIYIPDPSRVPEESQRTPYVARYIDKAATANGLFYGDRIQLPMEDIDHLVALLDDKTDCLKPVVEGAEGGHGAPAAGHGEAKKDAGGHGEAPAGHGEAAAGHGEPAAEGHGAPAAEGHGEAPAEGHGEETPVAEHGAESKGWMASIMGMVGLGGSEEAPAAEGHATADAAHDAAPAATVETSAAAEHPAEEKGWLDSMKGMVGLGEDKAPAEEAAHETPAKGHDDAAAAKAPAGDDHAAGNPEASAQDAHEEEAAAAKSADEQPAHEAPEAQAAEAPKDGSNAADAAGADWLAKLRAQPAGNAAKPATTSADPPAEDSDVLPQSATEKAREEKARADKEQAEKDKAHKPGTDEHADASH